MKAEHKIDTFNRPVSNYEFGGFGRIRLIQTGKRFDFKYCMYSGNNSISQIEEFIRQLQKAVNLAKKLKIKAGIK